MRPYPRPNPRALSGVAFLLAAAPYLAGAAEEADEQPPEGAAIEEVIVVGSKLNFSTQDSVDSVEILTADRLLRDGVFEISDAVSRTPGVSVIGGNLDNVSIRGINRNGTGGAGQSQAINIFLDGAPLSASAINSTDNLWDLQQVEVLRGSQSILQGRNAIGGAIVLTSNDPIYEWETAARIRAGNFGVRQYSALITGPIIADQLAFRITGDFNEADGFVTNPLNDDQADDEQDNLTVRAKILAEPAAIEALRAEFTVEYTETNSARTVPFSQSPAPTGSETADERRARLASFDATDYDTFSNFLPQSEIETVKLLTDLSYDLSNNITAEFIGTFERSENVNSQFSIQQNPFGGIGNAGESEVDTFSGDLRFKFDSEKLTGVFGFYYFDTESDGINTFTLEIAPITQSVFGISPNPAESIFTNGGNNIAATENYAAYTSWRYEPNEKWNIDLGLRVDRESFITETVDNVSLAIPSDCLLTLPGFVFGVPLPTIDILCQVAGETLFTFPPGEVLSDDVTVFLPSAAVTYNIDGDRSVFFGARRGYRAGGTTLAASLEAASDGFNVVRFDPEFLDTVEAGWRTVWFDGDLTFNGTLYYSQYTDQQVNFTNEVGLGITTNAGATDLYGLEASVDLRISDRWDLYGSLALKDTEFTEFLFTADDPETPEDETVDLAGNELDRAERVSLNIGASYRHENGFFGSASVSYKSSYYSDIFNLSESELGAGLTERVDAAAIVNARFGYEFARGAVSLVVANLFDEDSPELTNFAAAGVLNGTFGLNNQAGISLRPPRTVSLVLDLRL